MNQEIQKTRSNGAVITIPLGLIMFGLVLWTSFQTYMLVIESKMLKTVHANQENTVQQAVKLRNQLDSIAANTQVLADKGNTGAKTIVEELKKRGVTINPNAKAAPVK